ncbi:MAG: hypothetical protein ACK5GU_09450 [Chloroflexota bacterium]|jgi:hypothetical protein
MNIIQSAIELIDAGTDKGLRMRLLGGIAVAIHCPNSRNPGRSYRDIDLAIPAKSQAALTELMQAHGYHADREFNLLNGDSRMLFHCDAYQIDVFVGEFAMCHRLPLTFDAHPYTVAVAELLLTKLQIIELNPKDAHDGCALLHELQLGTSPEQQSTRVRIGQICGNDWGMWRTLTLNLERCVVYARTQDEVLATSVAQQVSALTTFLDQTPKTLAFKMRAAVGDRVRWYENPEEVER